MRILSLTYEYPPVGGGGGVVAAALNEALVQGGDKVTVVTSAMPGLARAELVRGVEIHRAWCLRRHRHYTTAAELLSTLIPTYRVARDLIRKRRPDIIHTHFVLPSGLLARRLGREFNLPYLLTAHGSDIPGYNPDRFERLHTLLRPYWRRIVNDAVAVTSPSNFLAGLIHRHIDREVRIVPNGYVPDVHYGRVKRKLVLVVARLFPRKGVQDFVESLRGHVTDWDIAVAGDGPQLEALRAQAQAQRSPVRFLGFVPKDELRGLYEEARIFVFPSIRENFPMVLLEAMDAGCAVISTDAEGCAEVVGDAGIVIEKSSPAAIRDSLLQLMRSEEACEELSRRAVLRAAQFRWPRISALYREIFDRVQRPVEPSLPIAAAGAVSPGS